MLKEELPLPPRCSEVSLGSLKCPILQGQKGIQLLPGPTWGPGSKVAAGRILH